MKLLIRVAVAILFISLSLRCTTYQKVNTPSSNAQTTLGQVIYQLDQVEPNEMILVTTHDQKKYEFEYLSHTQDTLKGILYHKLHNSHKVVEMEMKLSLNTITQVKTEKINYILSIGGPAMLLAGAVHIATARLFFSWNY
jgi:hypothetical protein